MAVVSVVWIKSSTGLYFYTISRDLEMMHMEPDQAASHVIDNRFLSQSALASFYEKDFQFERITSYKIVGYQQRDSSHAIVKVYATMNDGQSINMPFTMIRQGEQWYIYVPGYAASRN
ncbi:DUF4878 domain-containing protein [Alicyclobacillus suci]|uniref:DUF4878 domain-containing protein n=1 Tax=Alicyclobacillus suci TaxID=2816080 RepID=UPI001A8E954E|nr:DUF4878 domain-containing protein [Alicyclobacillus suci]